MKIRTCWRLACPATATGFTPTFAAPSEIRITEPGGRLLADLGRHVDLRQREIERVAHGGSAAAGLERRDRRAGERVISRRRLQHHRMAREFDRANLGGRRHAVEETGGGPLGRRQP